MDDQRARVLLSAERRRVERLLAGVATDARDDRSAANEDDGDIADPAERLTAEEVDDAVVDELQDRLAAIGRAEERLAAGTYGRSVRSGTVISDERLEADPTAELTAEEAASA